MVLADADYCLQLLLAVDVAGGVVRAVQQDCPCLAGDLLLDHAERRKGEVVLQRACDGNDAHVGHSGKGVHVRVIGLGNNDFVTWVAEGHQGKENSLRAAGGDQDIVHGDVNSNAVVVVLHDGLSECKVSVALAVGKNVIGIVADGFDCFPGTLDIGLADIQVIDLYPLLLGCPCVGRESSDGRGLKAADSIGYLHRFLPCSSALKPASLQRLPGHHRPDAGLSSCCQAAG